ncbi:DUF6502 family protein [Labrys okinawensis]|uniref:DUF6502 family protein n=1 Tax=Labrys okinawensis TaxID=346911 RepID=UPI0039BD8947
MEKGREFILPDAQRVHGPLARLLRPLVRMLVRSGVTFPHLCELLRELYINVAEHDFGLADKKQTDSRVSLLTGIHRKEVRRLRGAGAPVHVVPASVSSTSAILARWLAAPEFTDEHGNPLILPRTAAGTEPSFDRLVSSVTKDVRPRAVLDEWLNRELVSIGSDDRIALLDSALIPRGGDDQQLYYFGRNLHDHIAAAVANVSSPVPLFFERAVHYDAISADIAKLLEEKSKAIAKVALNKANRDAYAAAGDKESGDWRWTFGIYIYSEPASYDMQRAQLSEPASKRSDS